MSIKYPVCKLKELTSLVVYHRLKKCSDYYPEISHLWTKPTLKYGLKVGGWEASRTPQVQPIFWALSYRKIGLAGNNSNGFIKEGVNRRAAICMEQRIHGNTRFKILTVLIQLWIRKKGQQIPNLDESQQKCSLSRSTENPPPGFTTMASLKYHPKKSIPFALIPQSPTKQYLFITVSFPVT